MSGLTSTGAGALLAFQRALQTTSHNVSNASTDGYSRQRVDLAARPPQSGIAGGAGAGVGVVGIERLTDRFLVDQSRDQTSQFTRADRFATMAARVDQLLSGDGTSLAGPMSELFDAFSALQANPSGTPERRDVLSSADQLASRFNAIDRELNSLSADVSDRLSQSVAAVNELTRQLADLNQEIPRAAARSDGQPPNDLLDQRDRLLDALAGEVSIEVQEPGDGTVNVSTGSGQALVLGANRLDVQIVPDGADASRVSVAVAAGPGLVTLDRQITGGELGGLLDFRREVLDPALADTGRIAAVLGEAVNTAHRGGADATGRLGGDLFSQVEPAVLAAADNGGTATLSAGITDALSLEATSYRLRFDGAGYEAIDLQTNEGVPLSGSGTAADPLQLPGMELIVTGAPAVGDSFNLQGVATAAGQIGVAINRVERVAAASPVRAGADLANAGDARIKVDSITDPSDGALQSDSSIQFTDAANYSVNGGAPQPYTSGAAIDINGARFVIDGEPRAGDRFTVTAAAANGSDGANAALLADLRRSSILDGGTQSLTGSLASAVAAVGSTARGAESQRDAVGAIRDNVMGQLSSVNGVNLDEEAANLLKFQQSYQAAAQVLRVADEVFQTLLRATGR